MYLHYKTPNTDVSVSCARLRTNPDGGTTIRIVAISDLHGFLPDIVPAGDVLLIPGDVVVDNFSGIPGVQWDRKMQADWMRNEFYDWLDRRKHRHIIGIGGNHDFILEGKIANELPWNYLKDESIEIDGVLFHGSPWTPTFGGWAFMKPDNKLAAHWEKIPDNVDVLITHGPPQGILDIPGGHYGPESVGSSTLRWTLDNRLNNLKLHVFGHIHHSRGQVHSNGVTFANVTHVNEGYKPVHHPMVFDI